MFAGAVGAVGPLSPHAVNDPIAVAIASHFFIYLQTSVHLDQLEGRAGRILRAGSIGGKMTLHET